MATDELTKAKAANRELKKEVSELGRLYELRGRELTAARKSAAKADELNDYLAAANAKVASLEKDLAAAQKETEDLQAREARVEGMLEDVQALKRLAS
jgi:septation ring formation regulator EzrA